MSKDDPLVLLEGVLNAPVLGTSPRTVLKELPSELLDRIRVVLDERGILERAYHSMYGLIRQAVELDGDYDTDGFHESWQKLGELLWP